MKNFRNVLIGIFLGIMIASAFGATYVVTDKVAGKNDVRIMEPITLNGSNDDLTWNLEKMTRNYRMDVQFEQTGDSSTTTIYVEGAIFNPSFELWDRIDTITLTSPDTTGNVDVLWSVTNTPYVNYRFLVNATDTVAVGGAAKMTTD